MNIRIGSNIASLSAQRSLSTATDKLGSVTERLSSGLRINHSSDDAAGLAISSSLKADSRVFTTAIRNIADGISTLSIAQGALEQLSNIMIRQTELAEQSANGVYTVAQRKAIQSESDALTDEYNRIIGSTKFNGISLFESSNSKIRLQAGYGLDGSLSFDLGNEIYRAQGQGTFTATISVAAPSDPNSIRIVDLNNDGNLDLVSGGDDVAYLRVALGNGDGTFQAATTVTGPQLFGEDGLDLKDMNGDGILDIVSTRGNTDRVHIGLGNGDGTFRATVSYQYGGTSGSGIEVADFNRDGSMDVLVSDSTTGTVKFMAGGGDGTLSSAVTISTGSAPYSVDSADFNGDGKLDFVTTNSTDGTMQIYYGNGNGTFSLNRSFFIGTGARPTAISDFDRDGYLDIAVGSNDTNKITFIFGDAAGTFSRQTTLGFGSNVTDLLVEDFNGDGFDDVAAFRTGGNKYLGISLGNGDGTFRALSTFSIIDGLNQESGLGIGDVNNDGAIDFIAGRSTDDSLVILLANTEQEATVGKLYLMSQNGAKQSLDTAKVMLTSISAEIGRIGAFQSRLSHASGALFVQRENYNSANSRIEDADIAREAAELVSARIRQQIAGSVLAQANQIPSLALTLLR